MTNYIETAYPRALFVLRPMASYYGYSLKQGGDGLWEVTHHGSETVVKRFRDLDEVQAFGIGGWRTLGAG